MEKLFNNLFSTNNQNLNKENTLISEINDIKTNTYDVTKIFFIFDKYIKCHIKLNLQKKNILILR